ncbi:uncharacterized protein LOC124453473 [Xenia sp. Carnegie-2017]|uniref:uncharacterized protein LOC124453473 n=1 Tax=Xenia sp. Carnegie-2017 TaxID=2897299 RepID=UPI001F044A7C|nr:uncharacterized protein LOC124453473 [Xenia sp. Carnegie-2017]
MSSPKTWHVKKNTIGHLLFRMQAKMLMWFLLSCMLFSVVRIQGKIVSPRVSPKHRIVIRSTPSFDPAEEILEKFGDKNQMNSTNLKFLFKSIGLAVIDDDNNTKKKLQSQACFTSKHFFSMYSRNDGTINKTDFISLCPAMLYQMTKKECNSESIKMLDEEKEEGKEKPARAWGFGFLFVTIISFGSLIGAFVVPLMNTAIYKTLLMCMVSLAVGVLGGSGIFHLIPGALGLPVDDNDTSYLWKCSMIFLGLYVFFLLECSMKLYIRFKDKEKHQLYEEVTAFKPDAVEAKTMNFAHSSNGHCLNTNNDENFPADVISDNTYKKQNSRVELTSKGSQNNAKGMMLDAPKGRVIATVAWMIIIGDGLHNFIDGLAIGASFTGSVITGVSTSFAVMCEELPHELGDFAILLKSGLTYKEAMLANFLSACCCYIGLVIGLVLGYTTYSVKYIYGIAGGMFLYISLVDMLPEALEMAYVIGGNSKQKLIKMLCFVNVAMIFGYGVMLVIALYAGNINLGSPDCKMSVWFLFLFLIFSVVRIQGKIVSPRVSAKHRIVIRSTPSFDPAEEILEKFGDKNNMNLTNMKFLFESIGLALIEDDNSTWKSLQSQACFTSRHFFSMYSRNDGTINKTDLINLCPAMIYQMTKKECNSESIKMLDEEKEEGKEKPTRAWGFGFLFVTIISLGSLIGAFVKPLMNKTIYKMLLMCMVSLAVGVLGGSGIFHLIPHALDLHVDEIGANYLWKCCMILLGLYVFLVLECSMKLYIRFKDKGKHQLYREMTTFKPDAVEAKTLNFIRSSNGHNFIPNNDENFATDVIADNTYKKQNSRIELTSNAIQNNAEGKMLDAPKGRVIATVAWMIIIGDGLHNFIDGLAIGASFTGSVIIGVSTSVAVICEELPHELGDFAILLQSGLTYKEAMLANFLSACCCYVGLVIGLVLGYIKQTVKYIYGIAGGMFLYISLVDMLPEALEMAYVIGGNSKLKSIKMLCFVNVAIIFGYGVMLVIALYGENINL